MNFNHNTLEQPALDKFTSVFYFLNIPVKFLKLLFNSIASLKKRSCMKEHADIMLMLIWCVSVTKMMSELIFNNNFLS